MQQQKKINIFFRPAGVISFLAVILIIIGAVIWTINYSEGKKAMAAADKIQQGIIRLNVLAVNRQMVNDRVPASYSLALRDCRKNCFYELGVLTAEGQEIVLEKVFLGSVSVKSLRPTPGIFKIALLPDGEADGNSGVSNLIEISVAGGRSSFIASFDLADSWQVTDFKSFQNKLPEAYWSRLDAGDKARVEIVSTTVSGLPRSVGIYWRKGGYFSQLSVQFSQIAAVSRKDSRSEVRNFDSRLAALCFDLADNETASYLVTIEPRGTAAEYVRDISVRVFKEHNCRGDNLPEGVAAAELVKKDQQ